MCPGWLLWKELWVLSAGHTAQMGTLLLSASYREEGAKLSRCELSWNMWRNPASQAIPGPAQMGSGFHICPST